MIDPPVCSDFKVPRRLQKCGRQAVNPGFRALQAIAEAPWKRVVGGVGAGGKYSILQAGFTPRASRAELRPIVGESTRGQPYSSRQMQGRIMLERTGVQSGVRDRVLTYDSMTRIKGQAGIKLGGLF